VSALADGDSFRHRIHEGKVGLDRKIAPDNPKNQPGQQPFAGFLSYIEPIARRARYPMADIKSLIKNDEFVSDFVRFSAGLLDEKFLRRKYHVFSQNDWEQLGQSDELVEAIETARLRKQRDGSLKRELAQKYVLSGPSVLNEIMESAANERHKIDAVKALDALAGGESQAAPAEDRFVIQINLGADKILIDKPRRPTIEHDNADTDTPRGFCYPALAAKKDREDGGGGIPW
jgi:hypothetical protein